MARKARAARATLPSAALQAAYRKKLDMFVREMADSALWFVRAAYRKELPEILPQAAADAKTPAEILQGVLADRLNRWVYVMGGKARELARWFVARADQRVKMSLGNALRDAASHMTVSLRMTPEIENALDSLIAENVALIRSIPQYYATEIEGVVMRSVREGRDINYLEQEFGKRFSLTRNRVQLIARDQTNKATQAIHRVRSQSLGITEGYWVHRAGMKTSRISHEHMNGQRYTLSDGCYDPKLQRRIQPGELINCRCTFRPILPEIGGGDA